MNKDMLREILAWALSLALVHWLVEGGLGLQLLLAARVSARVAGKAFAICASAPAVEECGRLLGVAWLAQPN